MVVFSGKGLEVAERLARCVGPIPASDAGFILFMLGASIVCVMSELFDETIDRLSEASRPGGWVWVIVGGKRRVMMTEARTVELGLRAGVVWTATLAAAALHAAAVDEARRACVSLLARRALSRARLTEKLRERGTAEAVIAQTLDELTKAGLVDDAALASGIAEAHAARGPGRKHNALAALARAGLDAESLEGDVEQAARARHGSTLDEAIAVVRRLSTKGGKADATRGDVARLARQLASRGFDEDTSRAAIESVLGAIDMDSDETDVEEAP